MVWDLGIYFPSDICVSLACRTWNAPLCPWLSLELIFRPLLTGLKNRFADGIADRLTTSMQGNISSVPWLLTLKYFSLCLKKEENLRFWDNVCSYLLQIWCEFCLLHTCLSPLELEHIIMKCNNFHRNTPLMQHQFWDFNPIKSGKARLKILTINLQQVLCGVFCKDFLYAENIILGSVTCCTANICFWDKHGGLKGPMS